MSFDDPAAVDRLNAYLDALVRGQPAPSTDVDPDLAEIDRRFRSLDDAPEPTSAFGNRLWEELMDATLHPPTTILRPTPFLPNGREEPNLRFAPAIPARRHGLRPLTHLATAALLVLALGGLVVAFGGTRLDQLTGSGTNSGSIPAPFATPTDPPGVSSELLVTVTLPDETIPEEGFFFVDLNMVTYQPGASFAAEPRPDQNGPVAVYVFEGALGSRADRPIRLFRAAGTSEDVTPGTEVILLPGDSTLQWDHATGLALRNPGSDVLRFLSFGIIEALDPSRFSFAGIQTGDDTSMHPGDWIMEGAVVATLRRVTVAPGTTLPSVAESTATAFYIVAGTLTWQVVETETGATPWPAVTFGHDYRRWVTTFKMADDRRLVMSNPGDEPLVYIEVTFAPLAEETEA